MTEAALPGLAAIALAICCLGAALPASAAEAGEDQRRQLLSMSLEELMDIEIFSASKKRERVSEVPAAVFVITAEDLRRSGVSSIPDALRMVPGLHVAQMDVHQWAISARGFQSEVADKLLVLIDGRTVYSPLFSGVFWDVQDTMLEDIDRIEVIRGPGAAIWGSNAVNGVINIITRSAGQTEGGLVSTRNGSKGSVGALRYGAKLNDKTSWRAFLKHFGRSALPSLTQQESADDWQSLRGGFRLEHTTEAGDSLIFTGETYDGSVNEPIRQVQPAPPYFLLSSRDREFSGGFVLGRWSRRSAAGDDLSLQAYFDKVDFDSAIGTYTRDTLDLEFQHSLRLGRVDTIWGLGFRRNGDDMVNSPSVVFDPASKSTSLWSAFIQTELGFSEQRGALILGSKFEHNDFTGLEVQPTARLRWTPDERRTYWAAVSRAVQTPVRAFSEVRFDQAAGPLPQPMEIPFVGRVDSFLAGLVPSEGVESEELTSYEAGLRLQLSDSFYLSASAYLNSYDKLKSRLAVEPIVEFGRFGPFLHLGYQTVNGVRGEVRGLELVADWAPTDRWKVQAWYAFVDLDLEARPGFPAEAAELTAGLTPKNQASLRSSWDLGRRWEADLWLRYVDELPTGGAVSYFETDLRLAVRLGDQLELSLVGRNLLRDQHSEFTNFVLPGVPSEVERSVHGALSWTF